MLFSDCRLDARARNEPPGRRFPFAKCGPGQDPGKRPRAPSEARTGELENAGLPDPAIGLARLAASPACRRGARLRGLPDLATPSTRWRSTGRLDRWSSRRLATDLSCLGLFRARIGGSWPRRRRLARRRRRQSAPLLHHRRAGPRSRRRARWPRRQPRPLARTGRQRFPRPAAPGIHSGRVPSHRRRRRRRRRPGRRRQSPAAPASSTFRSTSRRGERNNRRRSRPLDFVTAGATIPALGCSPPPGHIFRRKAHAQNDHRRHRRRRPWRPPAATPSPAPARTSLRRPCRDEHRQRR